MVNKTECPVCHKIQNVYGKGDKIDINCKCGTTFSAQLIYKAPPKKEK